MMDLSALQGQKVNCAACHKEKTMTLLSMMPELGICDECVMAALKWGIGRWVAAGAPGHD